MALTFLDRKPDSGLGNIRSSPGDPSRNVDWVLLTTQGILTVIGCFVVYSASWTAVEGDPYAFATRQVVFAIAASVVMVAVMSVDYEWFKERAAFLYGSTIVLLVLLLLMGIAQGLDRISFDLGPINFQPAEAAKFTTLLALCAYLSEERSNDEVSYARFVGGLIMVGAPAVLIIVQPDLGSASVIVTIAMGVLLVAGAKPKYIALISFLSVATVASAFVGGFVNSYQQERLRVFLGQDTAEDSIYQVRNAIRAVGTGGVTGKGWLEGPLTNGGDVPVMWADFPFAAVGEQFGLVGCAVLLALFVVVLMRIWRIATLSRDLLGTYLCAGVFTMLLWQVFQNVGMTLGIMPVTGLPMPFISYGGSSLLTYFALFGIVQSVHMRRMR
ncbi:MAG: FtsW/RodA/SpoVE family cell cycle protein [Ilumatobacter sp.]|uniref:FtsW/RodA/SpoVE family cell cycle protein n=1 Tax=Ilumatobacter sp. TaxID=1967498 RepID=UPI002621DD0F|nr:FtsW/RodA/SpoVE family cell cycle protein [Ilumatobacter sp.]MDJ0771274.1 FtsW/RodA/SpoVE family cell cycle protein [Ilumatobacter sp.]